MSQACTVPSRYAKSMSTVDFIRWLACCWLAGCGRSLLARMAKAGSHGGQFGCSLAGQLLMNGPVDGWAATAGARPDAIAQRFARKPRCMAAHSWIISLISIAPMTEVCGGSQGTTAPRKLGGI